MSTRVLTGVVGFFDNPHALVEATKKVRGMKYEEFDCFTPFPVHGLDAAQGLKRSPLPFVTFGAGLAGFLAAFALQYGTSVIDWPLNVGGKPFNSWQAFVPIFFELTVLLAALATVGAMFAINGLPNITKKIFDPSITRDRFAIWIASPKKTEDNEPQVSALGPKKFVESEVISILQGLGAKDVRPTYAEGWF